MDYIIFFHIYIYLFKLSCKKRMRYMVIILPFLYLFGSYSLFSIFNKLKVNKFIWISFVIITSIFSLFIVNQTYENTFKVEISDETINNYYNYPIEETKVILSSPILIGYQDINPTIIYWTREGMYEYYDKLNISTYFINTCELFCLEKDINCNKGKEDFIKKLQLNYKQKFYNKERRCEYYVFTK